MTIKKTINKNDISGASFLKLGGENLTRIVNKSEVIHINLTDSGITEIDNHIEQIEAIRHAEPNDIIVVFLSSCPGGYLSTTQSFINAIVSTDAHVIGVLEGENASAATIIAMQCHELVVTPYSSMMIHSAHGGAVGTTANTERNAVFSAKWIDKLFRDVYKDFLTEEEFIDVNKGLNIYLNDDEISERLKKREEIRSNKQEVDESKHDCESPTVLEPVEKKTPPRKRVKKTT